MTVDWKTVIGNSATIVETHKRDGSWVSTPVTMIEYGAGAVFFTDSRTGKVKRIRNFADVRVAPATWRGVSTGKLAMATARILAGEENQKALQAMRHKHKFMFGLLLRVRYQLNGATPLMVELSDLRELS